MSLVVAGGDAHFSFENKRVVKRFIRTVGEVRPHYVVLMGDILDFRNWSKFLPEPGHRTSDELYAAQTFLMKVRDEAGTKCKICYLEGNHELRIRKNVARKIPEAYDLDELTVPELLCFKDYKIKWYSTHDRLRIDGLLYRHGDRISAIPGKTALMHIQKFWESIVVGHCHRMAQIPCRVGDDYKIGVETGCMCSNDAALGYDTEPNWIPGFCVIDNGDVELIWKV